MHRLLLVLLLGSPAAFAETRYEIDLAKTALHTLAVTVEADCRAANCDFQMPVWNALYQIRDFAQYVSRFEAAGSNGERLAHRMISPSVWRVEAAPGERVRLRYEYFADEPGPFGCSATERHVFLNFAQILLYPAGGLREPMSVAFRNKPAGWRIALELAERDGAFQAKNYDELVDAPAELSAFDEADFFVAGKRLRLVVDGDRQDYDLGRMEDTARRVAAAAIAIMQDKPFSDYAFIYHFRKGGGGGMEHANSAAIDAPAQCRDCDLSGVTAHEFFHLWNVKRIRPRSLEPIDYTRENVTPSLWFSEGVTSAYGNYIQLQAGLEEPGEFLSRLQSQITRYERMPARLAQSAEESSIAAWLERYPYYGRPARSISYYLKGELAGYLLDLAIRHASGNRRSLDDVMRGLNSAYARQGRYFEDTAAIERLASEAAGRDLKEFFDAVIRRPAPIDWNRYLGYAGLRLAASVTSRPELGVDVRRLRGSGVVVTGVAPGSAGERAGIDLGDRLLALNHRPVGRWVEEELEAPVRQPGDRVTLEVERAGRKLSLTAVPDFVQRTEYRIQVMPDASVEEKAIREAWLRSSGNEGMKTVRSEAAPAQERAAGGGSR
ncbi:MAG TPA: PDZ domain-containing protein [Bryobacterales bacterium]|nr:PDZ domain-containing protein [Bryobacterales bacterium]